MTDPQIPAWMMGADRFRKWWVVYEALCLPGAVILWSGSDPLTTFVDWIFFLSLIVYPVLIVQAYRVLRDLRAAGLSRVGAWVVPLVPTLMFYACPSFEPP